MIDTKFTNGPWDWEHDNDTASVIQVFSKAEEAKGDPDICRIQHEPNASLIAAAPEMYEMLKACSEILKKCDLHNASRDVDNLLAKARGEL